MSTTVPSTSIDAVLSAAVDRGLVPGVVAAAADASGVVYEGAAGRRALDGDQPMTTDTVFSIASMTKAVTGTAAMQLVEQGRLDLDAPLGAVLPRLADPQVLDGWAEDGSPVLRPARRPLTLRHLLTHTSGFSYFIWNEDCRRYIDHAGLPSILSGKLAALDQPLMFDPGERWDYGIGIDLAGLVIEAVSGLSLDAYLDQYVLGPLQMNDTGFVLGADQTARVASTHVRRPDGTLEALPRAVPPAPESFLGGGGLHSTAPDYLRFLRMLVGGGVLDGVRVLQSDTVITMAQNHIGDLEVGPLTSVVPLASNDVDFFPGIPKKYGLSFLITTEDLPAGRRAGSLSWAGMRNSYYWLDPHAQVAGVLMIQISPFFDPGALEVLDGFERAVYSGR